ncbi:hypothetical protein [Pseudomonas sp. RL_105y_Pfl1_103]|uniref:hypothetical protein n=1 Tax=Pseudomonas sp. RL_105y_Pfl1_103 TaxID=3088707 RepID=UPI0030DCC42A
MAMHGFSRHSGSGGGGGAGPVDYMVDDDYYDKANQIWKPRKPAPKVVEGDAQLMIEMIDALDTKHLYTSGVLSFTRDDTEKLKSHGLDEAVHDITGRLKEMLFAGISQEHWQVLIVAHTHLDRLELHYVTPRHNYEVGRAWNPAPPGEGKFRQMDALVDLINVKYGLDDPRDPLRAKLTKDPQWTPNGSKPLREQLNQFFTELVADNVISNREELIKFAQNAGLTITRSGSDYIGVKAPNYNKPVRLRGEIYHERFTSTAQLADTKTKSAERASYLEVPAVARRYKAALKERGDFVEKRFEKALGKCRNSENHKDLQKFYGAKRGEIFEVDEVRGSNDCGPVDFSRFYSYKDGELNDKFGAETDSIITTAERRISNTEQSTSIASDKFRRASNAVQHAASEVGKATQRPETMTHAFVRAIESISIISGGAEAASVEGSAGTGDADSDRIINAKRADATAMNLRNAKITTAGDLSL